MTAASRPANRVVFIVPLVMLLVAGIQVVRVATLDQSSWQGAGFGMFATYDFDDTRVVVAHTVGPDGDHTPVPLDELVDGALLRRARVVPGGAALDQIAGQLASRLPDDARRIVVEVRGPRLDEDVVTHHVVARVSVDG